MNFEEFISHLRFNLKTTEIKKIHFFYNEKKTYSNQDEKYKSIVEKIIHDIEGKLLSEVKIQDHIKDSYNDYSLKQFLQNDLLKSENEALIEIRKGQTELKWIDIENFKNLIINKHHNQDKKEENKIKIILSLGSIKFLESILIILLVIFTHIYINIVTILDISIFNQRIMDIFNTNKSCITKFYDLNSPYLVNIWMYECLVPV